MALTERQKQIADLLDKGKTPAEIAKKLKITENAVYQQRRRIKQADGSAPKTRKPRAGRTAGRKTTTRRRAARQPRETPAPVASAPSRPMTPLQAIRARREAISSGLKELVSARDAAERALAAATKAHDEALDKQGAELAQLDRAEEALTGKGQTAAKPKRQSSRKGTGTVKNAAPVQPDPEAEAELAAAQAASAAANGQAPVNDSEPAVRDATIDEQQAALDAGGDFDAAASEPVGVAEGGFEQPDAFTDE